MSCNYSECYLSHNIYFSYRKNKQFSNVFLIKVLETCLFITISQFEFDTKLQLKLINFVFTELRLH